MYIQTIKELISFMWAYKEFWKEIAYVIMNSTFLSLKIPFSYGKKKATALHH